MNKNRLFQKNDNSSLPNNSSSAFDNEYIKSLAVRVQKLEEGLEREQRENRLLKDELTRLSKIVEDRRQQTVLNVIQTDCVEDLSNNDEKQEVDFSSVDTNVKEIEEWLYFSTPVKGAFHISKKMRQGESMVCYRINPNSRTIEFIHSSMDSRLISYKNEYLLPVCDIINSPTSPSSIKMESPGEVKKQGDEFVIDQNNKIKIKLI